jgi:hypothetical protein
MLLRRFSKAPYNHEQQEDLGRRFKRSEKVTAYFWRFGTGGENANDFEVDVGWEDIETLIDDFATEGNLNALRLKKAVQLLASLESALDSRSVSAEPQVINRARSS